MTHGEILSRITNDVDTLSQSLNQSATQLITSVTMIIGVLVMMLSISPLMTVVAILILPVAMGLISVIVKHSPEIFPGSAGISGTRQQSGGRGVRRPQYREAFNKKKT